MTFFDEDCPGNAPAALPSQALAPRVRERRFIAFGERLKGWRGQMTIERAAQRVRSLGVPFSQGTLSGWELGWVGKPDPMRLLALASVYDVAVAEVFAALKESRADVSEARFRTDSLDTGAGGTDDREITKTERVDKSNESQELAEQFGKDLGGTEPPETPPDVNVEGGSLAATAPPPARLLPTDTERLLDIYYQLGPALRDAMRAADDMLSLFGDRGIDVEDPTAPRDKSQRDTKTPDGRGRSA